MKFITELKIVMRIKINQIVFFGQNKHVSGVIYQHFETASNIWGFQNIPFL